MPIYNVYAIIILRPYRKCSSVYVRVLTTVSCGCVYVINANGHKKNSDDPTAVRVIQHQPWKCLVGMVVMTTTVVVVVVVV